jgi:hypothetical protein
MQNFENTLKNLSRFGRKNLKRGAIFLFMVLVFAPIASAGIGGTISGNVYNSNSYTLGEAQVDLYNYVNVDTPGIVSTIESSPLAETEKTWDTVNPTTGQPPGVPDSTAIFSDSTATNTEPTGLVVLPSWQNDDATDTNLAPSGSAGITQQLSDTTATNSAPMGSAPISAQNADTAATNTAPLGVSAAISSQTDDSAATNTPPAGVSASIAPQFKDGSATNVKPAGLTDPKPQTSDSMRTLVAPAGSVAITPNSADAGSTSVQPTGAPVSQSGLWYVGLMVIEADDDGDSVADDTIFWVITDVAVSGTYDTLSLSYEDSTNYGDGALGDQLVDLGDDEMINDDETVTLGTYDFVIKFTSNPSTVSPDIWITSAEWYEGTFNIDLDGDGTVGGAEFLYYSLTDSDSDGMYDTMDLSADDTTFGEGGALGDGLTTTNNDERIKSIMPAMTDVRLETHNFKVSLWEDPASAGADSAIWSWEWYTGSLSIDWDADGFLDLNIILFCLSDRDSDGVYDRVDISESSSPDFEEGDLWDLWCSAGDDEASTDTDSDGITVALGVYDFNVSFNVAPAASNPDFWIRSYNWISGAIDLEGQAITAGSSDINSDGLFDRIYLDLSPWPAGDGDFGDANEGPYQASDTISDGNLVLDYFVNTIYASPVILPWYIAELIPSGATVPSPTSDWYVGTISLAGQEYPYAVSDYDGAPGYEAVEFDLDLDKALDSPPGIGDDGSDGSPFGFTVGGDIYWVIWVDQNDIRVLPNPWSPSLTPSFDYNNDVVQFGGSPVYYYGLIQEAVLGELNGDADFSDEFEAVVVDVNDDGTYDWVYIDHNDDNMMGNGVGPGPGGAYPAPWVIWPITGATLTAINPDGQTIFINGMPVTTSSSVTVAESISSGQSDRYISSVGWNTDPDSVQMTTPNPQNANGGATTIMPGGIWWNSGKGSSATSTGTQPTGSVSISSNGFDAGVTSSSPPGAPPSTSGFWYFGTFQLDCDADGLADDIVNWVLTDWFFGIPGSYDTISLSYDWASFSDGNLWDLYLDGSDDEWMVVGPAVVQFETFWFTVTFDSDPTSDGDDARITSTTWFAGSWNMDANDDGDAVDRMYYVLSDADSNGVYDTMDISCEDKTYGEGTLTNRVVDYFDFGDNTDDERIDATSDVTLGNSFLFTVGFDGGPLLDVNDARIQSKEWYDGTFTIDADDDGTADDTVNFALSDMNSDGLYDTWDLSLDDTTYEEGSLGDYDVSDPDNDERIQIVIQDNFDGVNMGSPTWDTPVGASSFIEWNRMSTNPFSPVGPLQNPVNEYHSGTDSFWCGAPNFNDPAGGWASSPGVGFAWDERLKLLSIDLSSSSTATLTFEHYYNFNDFSFDGGNVHISTVGQFGPWNLLSPEGGYDAVLDPVWSTGEEAYSGSNMEWNTATFDLSAYTGNVVWLRWRAVTSTDGWDDQDGFANGDGWFIDDVMIQTARYITIGPSFEFLAEFDIAPNIDGDDVRITSNEWYEGTFLIDGWGNGFAFEIVNYVLTDTDSDGIYDSMDLSIDDAMYGEGILNDNVVDWKALGNDERIDATSDLTLGIYYLFTCAFDGGPNVDSDDARITSKEWYEGGYKIDADGDGIAWEYIYFVLTDTDSDGLYEAMDLSMDTTYGDGDTNDLVVDLSGGGNDELITATTDLTLGDYYLFMNGFDIGPNVDAVDARIRSEEWYEGTFTTDGDDSGVADDTVYYVLSDTNSDGLYDTIDLSIDDPSPVFGEGNLNDVTVDWSGVGNDERQSIVIKDQFDGQSIGFPFWWDAVGASGFIEWNIDSAQGQFSSGTTSYWCGAPNVNDPAAGWATPPGYGDFWDEELTLFMVNLLFANDAVLTFEHYYDLEQDYDGGAVYVSTTGIGGPWTLLDPVGGYDEFVTSLGDNGYTGDSGGWSSAEFDLTPYVGNFVWLQWKMTSDSMWSDEDGGWDGYGWFIDDVTVLADRHITLGYSYEFTVEFDLAPNADVDDAWITSNEWYTGDWIIDADDENDDGVPDDAVKYVLSDTDSDGVYDTMDISLNDDVFGETGGGGLSDLVVDYNSDTNNFDDERITVQTDITLGDSLLFTCEFDPNPNNMDFDDARILSVEWYEGTFSIDYDGDGVVDPDSVNYVLSDISSQGVYIPFMDISTDDTTYGEGDLMDRVTAADNDEVIWFFGGEFVTLGTYTYHVESFDQLFDGLDVNDGVNYDERDARITMSQWFWGSALLEGNTRYAVVADSDSDGVYDEVYIDVNDNDNWGDVGVDAIGVPVSGTFQGSLLELQYTVTYIDPQGQYFEIQPTAASVGATPSWFVGRVEAPAASGNWYDVVLSDTDFDTIYETVDFDTDLPGDSVVDVLGITETTGWVFLSGKNYQVINIDDWGWNVRIISYTDAILGPQNDISLSDTFHFGVISEADYTLNFNQDGDMTDYYHTIVADDTFFGFYQTVFIDRDNDFDLSTESPYAVGSQFTITSLPPMEDHEYDIDLVDPLGDYYAFKQINHPVDTYFTRADGYYSLDAPIDGYYWIEISQPSASWGYGTMTDTDFGGGIYISAGDAIEDWNEYLMQTGNFIFGHVNDSISSNPITQAMVEVYDSSGVLVISTLTKADGSYQLAVVPGFDYDLVFSYPGYYTDDGRASGTWQNLFVTGNLYSRDVLLVYDITPPAITLDYPAESQTVTGIETVSATATDDFQLDTIEVSFDYGATWYPMTSIGGNVFEFIWDTTAHTEGQYRVTVRATDTAGSTDSEFVDVYVSNDATDPEVTVVSPSNNDFIEGIYTIQVLALDNHALETVEVEVGSVTYQMTYNAITGYYEHPLDTGVYGDGLNSLSATATDYNGNFAVHTFASGVNIDNTHPSLWVNSPTDGETVYDLVNIDCDSVDLGAYVPTVEYKIDSGSWTILTGSEVLGWTDSWDSYLVTNGAHTIHYRSYDSIGHVTSESITVTVDNDYPQATVVAPLYDEYLAGTYTFQVLATDEVWVSGVYISINGIDYDCAYNSGSGFWEVALDTTTISDDMYDVYATVDDGVAGHTQSSGFVDFYIDNTHPTLSISSPYNWETVTGASVVLFADSVDNGFFSPTVEYRIDAGIWTNLPGSELLGWTTTWDSTTVSNGVHTIHFRSYDDAGHISTDSVTITVDNDTPVVFVIAPQASDYLEGTYTFKVAASDEISLTNVYITIDVTDYTLGYNSASGYWEVTLDTEGFSEGVHGITATAQDGILAHTQTTALVSFNVDNLEPVLSIIAPANGETVFGSTVLIDVDCWDEGVSVPTVEYKIDSGSWISLSGSEPTGWTDSWDSTSVSHAAHTLTFKAYDAIGHMVTDSIWVTVDNDNPVVSIVSPQVDEYIQGTYTFTIYASDAIGVTNVYMTINAVDYTAGYNSDSGFWEVIVDTNTISDGIHGITATAEDGIVSHTQTTVSYDFNCDNNAPVLSIDSPSHDSIVFGSSVMIIASATDDGVYVPTVQYRIDKGAWMTLSGSEILGWTDSWDSTTVSYGVHTIHFRAYDSIGHLVSNSITVTVDNDSPQVLIVTPLINEYIQGTYTFKVSASDPGGLTNVYITINGIDYTAGYNSDSGFWEVDIDTQTISDGIYGITATAEDGISGHEQTSATYDFNIDNNAPTLSITYPVFGETVFGDLFTIDVSSTDVGVFVPTVQYRIDKGSWMDLLGSEVLGWTASWDTSTVSNGAHTLIIRAYDGIGHIVTETLDITVDNDLPLVQIATPLLEEYVQGIYLFRISATDDVQVTNVHITFNGIDYTTEYNSASGYWEVAIDTSTLTDGTFTITATAEDGIPGHTQTTAAFDFNVDNHAPSLSITNPIPGAYVMGDIIFDVVGSDTFIDSVEYNVDGTGWISIDTAWDSDDHSDGTHTITFRATDYAGHVTEETITVVVDNADLDGDGIGDLADSDIDGDGVANEFDAFPYDDSEWIDTDSDGIGDIMDTDDDGDSVLDIQDRFPLSLHEYLDTDSDAIGNNADTDDDGDGIPDINDAFPMDATETVDLDRDGIGDNSDPDVDGDGFENSADAFPTDPHEWNDNDGDGIGDNADPDDDNDGVADLSDYAPMNKNIQLEPFWWWWILFAVLIFFAIFMYFITNRTNKALLEDEEKYMTDHEDLSEKSPKSRHDDYEITIPPPPPRKIPTAYTATDLEFMKKAQLLDIAKEMGLPVEGTKADIISRINVAQADNTVEEVKNTLRDV